jgi:nucleotide-binding universal stress UspA family protein
VCFQNILFATDFLPASARAFSFALALAEDCRTKLVLLHMVPPMSFADGASGYGAAAYNSEDLAAWHAQVRQESLRRLEALIPDDAKLTVPLEYMVETSFLPDGILDAAGIHHSELIVMGANRTRTPRVAAHLPWTVIHNVLCKAQCPVLTLRDPEV